jgi:hypothetical protein
MSNIKSQRGRPNLWSKQEEAALVELTRAPEEWSAQQIASLLARQGFPLRSRAAVIGRLHRNKIALRGERMALPTHVASARTMRRRNKIAREKFLAAVGGAEPERHPSDRKAAKAKAMRAFSFNKTKPGEGIGPNMAVFKQHATLDGDALGMALVDLSLNQCHFPFGQIAPFAYCGQPCVEGEPYCEKHYRLTHTHTNMRPYNDAL